MGVEDFLYEKKGKKQLENSTKIKIEKVKAKVEFKKLK